MDPNNVLSQEPLSSGLPSLPSLNPLGTGTSLNAPISQAQGVLSQLNSQPGGQPTPQGGGGILGDLKRLAPTIGAVGLPAIADLLTGGLAAPADIALAGIGGGLGQGVQNLGDNKGFLSGNDITSGLESAAGQGAGELVGKGLQVGGKFLTDQAGKAADAATAAGKPTALDEATSIKNNYGGTRPGVQTANNMQDNLNLMQQWGLDHTDPNAMQHASNGGLFINDIDNTALESGQPLSTPSLLSSSETNLNGNLRDAVTQASPEEQQALQDSGLLTNTGTVPETITPMQANQYAQQLNAQLRDVRATMDNAQANGRAQDYNAAKQQYSQLQSIYDNVQSKLSSPEIDQAIAARTISPEEKTLLESTYGPGEASHIEAAVNGAQTHSDLVKAKLPFAQMNSISKQALGDMQAPATARGVARVSQDVPAAPAQSKGILSMLPTKARGLEGMGALIEMAMGHPATAAALTAANVLSSPTGMKVGGSVLSKLGGSVVPGAAGALVGSSPSTIAPVQGGSTIPDMNGNLENSQLEAAINAALMTAQAQAAHPYMPGSGSVLPTLQALIGAGTAAQGAQAQSQNLANTFNAAGGAQGPVMGLLSQLGQTFTGGPASLLNNQVAQQGASTNQALQAAGSAPAPLPSITQSPEAANQAIAGIRNLLSTLGGGQYSPTLGNL
jgi:hypothetical protein